MDYLEPLIREHRLIRRLANRMEQELETLKNGAPPDLDFIHAAIDFAETYMEDSHHAKEETILFAALNRKDIAVEHRHMIEEFVTQHRDSRALAERLGDLRARFLESEPGALADLIRKLHSAVAFYRQHIAREETYFFPAAVKYLSAGELDAMLSDFHEFDRDFLHNRFSALLNKFTE